MAARLIAARETRTGAIAGFAARVIKWQAVHGRRGLPWQQTRDPYRVWLAEIMLQQTQVATVISYYQRFIARYADVRVLAAARSADVMALWSGLGYYARARNLHACAQTVVAEHGGGFPRASAALAQLPGIGRSTAAAIAAFCSDERAPILDGNVKRVLARHFGVADDPRTASGERAFWALAQSLLPRRRARMPAYTQGLMDLGATICTRSAPNCSNCPLRASCAAFREQRVNELPAQRRAGTVPVRKAHWLVLRRSGFVLLEQRPPRGVWGGLLAPPSFPTRAALSSAVRSLGATANVVALPMRRHGFSHFSLEFTPHVVRIEGAAQTWPPAGSAAVWERSSWLALKRAEAAALPAPVRRLLIDLRDDCPITAAAPAGRQ